MNTEKILKFFLPGSLKIFFTVVFLIVVSAFGAKMAKASGFIDSGSIADCTPYSNIYNVGTACSLANEGNIVGFVNFANTLLGNPNAFIVGQQVGGTAALGLKGIVVPEFDPAGPPQSCFTYKNSADTSAGCNITCTQGTQTVYGYIPATSPGVDMCPGPSGNGAPGAGAFDFNLIITPHKASVPRGTTMDFFITLPTNDSSTFPVTLTQFNPCPNNATCGFWNGVSFVGGPNDPVTGGSGQPWIYRIQTTGGTLPGPYTIFVQGVDQDASSFFATRSDQAELDVTGQNCSLSVTDDQLTGCGYVGFTGYSYFDLTSVNLGPTWPGNKGTAPEDNFVALDQNYGNGEIVPGSGLNDTSWEGQSEVWEGNFNFSGGTYTFTAKTTGRNYINSPNTESIFIDGSLAFAVDGNNGQKTFATNLSKGKHVVEVIYQVVPQSSTNYDPVTSAKSIYLAWSSPAPSIQLSPTSIPFNAVSGSATPTPQTLTISDPIGGTTLNWRAQTDQNWCRVNGINNAGSITGTSPNGSPASVSVSVDAPSSVNTYNCTITVFDNGSSPAASNSPQYATVTYTVAAGSCPNPATALVSLSSSTMNVGDVGSVTAPAGFTGGSFSSGDPTVATIGAQVGNSASINGVAQGTSVISGNGWTYTPSSATACALGGQVLTVNPPACTPESYQPATSGFALSSHPSGPTGGSLSVPSTDSSFYAFVDYGAANDAIEPPFASGAAACVFDTFLGTVGRFVCATPAVSGTPYTYQTRTNNHPLSSNVCTSSDQTIGDVTVTSGGGVTPPNPGPTCNSSNVGPCQPFGGADPTCGQVKITWTDTSGGVATFIIYKDGVQIGTAPVGQSYFVYSPGDTNNHTYSIAAVVGLITSAPASGPSSTVAAISCTADLGNSDKDIVAINGAPVVPAPQPCNNQTNGLPTNGLFNNDDIVTFQINFCNRNGSGVAAASGITLTDALTNMQAPTGGYKLRYSTDGVNFTNLTQDGSCKTVAQLSSGHYAVCGTAPNQTINVNLSGSGFNVAPGGVENLRMDGQIVAVGNITFGRIQNQATISYGSNGGPPDLQKTVSTPLILFYNGGSVPTRGETP